MNNGICETCSHESVCKYKEDFNRIYTDVSNDVFNNVFNLSCNEYTESEDYKIYLENGCIM